MTSGAYISAIGHGALILWALFGGFFLSARDPLPAQASNVSLITSEEFTALALPNDAPLVPFEAPQAVEPGAQDDAPEILPTAAAALESLIPTEVSTPEVEIVPAVIPDIPVPDAQVTEQSPIAPSPPAVEDTPNLDVSDEPKPAPAPRVAPVAAPTPAPDAEVAEEEAPETVPDENAETVVPDAPATAPQEAATEIVTEAEVPSSAPTASLRPRARPAPRPAVAEPSQPKDDPVSEAVAEAVATETPEPARPAGPPLTGGQIEGFRVAVGNCWNVDGGSAAAKITVTVAFSLDRSGKLVPGSLEFVGSTKGEKSAINVAFEAARRAIIRCGAQGYDLPIEKYERWKDIELTFNPEGMRIK